MEDLVVPGLETTHRTYERAAADIPIASKHTASCHTMPQKQNNSPNIIIQFVSRKHKIEVLKLSKRLKGTGVYVNEHLTKRNTEIARQARILREEERIQGTWTRNCKVTIRLNGAPEQAKVIAVRDSKDLDQYK